MSHSRGGTGASRAPRTARTTRTPRVHPSPRAGFSEVGLLSAGFLALLVVAGLILFVFLEFDTDPAKTPLDPETGAAVEPHAHSSGPVTTLAPDGTRQLIGADGQPIEGLRSAPGIEVGADLPYKSAAKLFDGIGRITGFIEEPQGAPFPDSWRLIIEPSKYVLGREHAAPRQVLELPGNQRSFEVNDLPLGAYRVYAEGQGVDSIAHEVTLFAVPDQPPATVQMHKHLAMRFTAVRGAQGTVVDGEGRPLDGLPVFFLPTDVEGGKGLSTQTNANGNWALPKAGAGTYRLLLGHRQRPLIEPETLVVHPASAGRGPLDHRSTVPATQTLHLVVMDGMGRGLPGARVRGIGPSPVDLEVDSTGVATARFLLPGFYSLRAEHEVLALQGNGRVEVRLTGPPQEFKIICRP